jgi:hypothetical protein
MPSKSEKQRKFMGYLYSLKKAGKKSPKWKKASKKIKKTVNSLTNTQLKDFMKKESLTHILNFKDFLGKVE